MPSLPKYENCEHSLFISYGFSDNEPFNWVDEIKSLINRHLRAKIPSFKPVFLSCKNTFSSGDISDELESKLKQSFAMIMVIGDGYANSRWCEEELKLFKRFFGSEGFASRLFIVAKTRPALEKVKNGDNWRSCIDLSKLFYLEMWDEENHDEGMLPRTGENYDAKFEKNVWKISNNLTEKIKTSLSIDAGASNQVRSRSSLSTIGIAPVTSPELETNSAQLQQNLAEIGLNCVVLSKDLITYYDPDGNDVQKALAPLDALIVPFQEAMPLLLAYTPGGHLSMLKQEWLKTGHQRQIIWYKPSSESASAGNLAAKHLQAIRSLGHVYSNIDDITAVLSDGQSRRGDFIRIRIQDNPAVRVYGALKLEMKKIWRDKFRDGHTDVPRLEFSYLNMGALDESQGDAYGYVVVNAVPLNSVKSLKAQIEEVQRLPNGYDLEGRIALVIRPGHQGAEPPVDWPPIKCKQLGENNDVPKIDLNPDGLTAIEEFLSTLLTLYKEDRESKRAIANVG